jgi:chromosome segregation ATPase
MSEEKKDNDFIGMLKKMKNETKSPSIIRDTLDQLQKLKEENEEIKAKIGNHNELIRASEELLKKTLEAKEKLKEENREALNKLQLELTEIKKQNANYSNKIYILESNLKEKEDILKAKPPTDSAMNQTLITDLSTELAEKKGQISILINKINTLESKIEETTREKEISISNIDGTETSGLMTQISEFENKIQILEFKIENLTQENKALKEEISTQTSDYTIDYVVPVIDAVTPVKELESSSSTLETLCQDLQSDLNKYRKIIEMLKNENVALKRNQESISAPVVSEDIKALKKENEVLIKEISELQKSIQIESLKLAKPDDSEIRIKILQDELMEKERLIVKLKASEPTQIISAPVGPMTSLIEDLQANINKLKMTIIEKNKIIEEFKILNE